MHRWSGWAEIRTYDRCREPAPRVPMRILARVRDLVAAEQAWGAELRLTRSGGRWHVWLEGPRPGTYAAGLAQPGVVPIFKALGSLAPASYGALEVVSATGLVTRWTMTRGSVALAEVVPAVAR
jgi:hypothetical protein